MDSRSSETGEVIQPPQQKQLINIVDLAENLTEGSIVRRDRKDIYGLSLSDHRRIDISTLTSDGRVAFPEHPLVTISVIKDDGTAKHTTIYNISRDGAELKIEKHETTTTEESEREAKEAMEKFMIELKSSGVVSEETSKLLERYDRRRTEEGRELERKFGYSYVNGPEAKALFDDLQSLKQS